MTASQTLVAVGGGWAIAAGIVLAAAAVVFVVQWLLAHRVSRPWAVSLASRSAPPAYLLAGAAAAKVGLNQVSAVGDADEPRLGAQLLGGLEGAVQHALLLVLIGSLAWFVVQLVQVFVAVFLQDIEEEHGAQSTRVRRVRTQVMLVQRVVAAAIVVIAVGAMLFTWEQVRVLGAGVLASAGVFGIVLGIAAQRSIGNLFAGLQLAFSDVLHVDDVVVVEGEWGQVEELTLSYVVVRVWDGRRLVLPVSYFTETPFQNWTKADPSIIGTVYLRLDWSVPVDEVRNHLYDQLKEHPLWDGGAWGLVVTDTSTTGLVEVRATMGAADGSAAWTLTCDMRERLVAYVRERYPESLPRLRAEVVGAETGRSGNAG